MINIKTEVLIAIISISITIFVNLFAVLRLTWKIASMYGELNQRISKNKNDINSIGQIMRGEITRSSETVEGNLQAQIWQTSVRVNGIEDFLEDKGYKPPTFQRH